MTDGSSSSDRQRCLWGLPCCMDSWPVHEPLLFYALLFRIIESQNQSMIGLMTFKIIQFQPLPCTRCPSANQVAQCPIHGLGHPHCSPSIPSHPSPPRIFFFFSLVSLVGLVRPYLGQTTTELPHSGLLHFIVSS